ncbi:MAG TPA: polysaccharide deacetylase family protein [Candidatus Dormibacteraeota bacterium]|nr:polysaccharide deacetylase family protein [Candidatus Dormibacteraeota bacterium]
MAGLLCACSDTVPAATGVATSTQYSLLPDTSAPPATAPGASAGSTATPSARPVAPAAATPTSGTAASPHAQPPLSLAGPIWTRLPTTSHVVALTFDAGGNDAGVTSILTTLATQHVPATFFLTGLWTRQYASEAQAISGAHAVGNHTQTHAHLPALADAAVATELTQAEQAIRDTTGQDPRPLFRFPYGDSDTRTLQDVHAQGYGAIGWTVDTLGWEGRRAGQSAASVVQRVLRSLGGGEIVLMHVGSAPDGTTLDADALPQVIDALRARGYGFVSLATFDH